MPSFPQSSYSTESSEKRRVTRRRGFSGVRRAFCRKGTQKRSSFVPADDGNGNSMASVASRTPGYFVQEARGDNKALEPMNPLVNQLENSPRFYEDLVVCITSERRSSAFHSIRGYANDAMSKGIIMYIEK
ncbi:hypothetical protein CIHG_09582 [Coccidioides immitis H538.4]|uniref:Uncharacterized protein n=2 Tax=Coccidioides immitis TaxID=5501 RepID=A0A0J8S3W1_COCIT|nr:hypothetical protein CIRG_03880 [Coccidioides immitis RMSCC 2394]KMU91842.1 hypothetical protein CIHG_09582 [Coccidioides immitis H538.4]